jgi:hypothetical protein
MPERIFDDVRLRDGKVDAITFFKAIQHKSLKACSSYPFISRKYSHEIILALINTAAPGPYPNVITMLREAPIGIVQFFILFANDINLKLSDSLGLGEIVLQREDLTLKEFSLLIAVLKDRNYCNFSVRTSTGFSIIENILFSSTTIPEFERKIEELIIAGARISPRTARIAAEELNIGNYSVMVTICRTLNSIPYRSIITKAINRAEAQGGTDESYYLAAETISAVIANMSSFKRLSIELPAPIINLIDRGGLPENSVIWGITINGKPAHEVFSEVTCNNCISSPKTLFMFLREGRIDAIHFTEIILSFIKVLPEDRASRLAASTYNFYLVNRHYFSETTALVLENAIEKFTDLSRIEPSSGASLPEISIENKVSASKVILRKKRSCEPPRSTVSTPSVDEDERIERPPTHNKRNIRRYSDDRAVPSSIPRKIKPLRKKAREDVLSRQPLPFMGIASTARASKKLAAGAKYRYKPSESEHERCMAEDADDNSGVMLPRIKLSKQPKNFRF